MNDKLKKVIKNPWVISIGSAIIAFFLISALKSLEADINFVEGIKIIYFYLFNLAKSILLFKASLWIYILVFLVILIIIEFILKFKKSSKPLWLDYKRDHVNGIWFEWDYIKDFNKYKINNLRPICSDCHCELSKGIDDSNLIDKYYLYCPSCQKRFEMINQREINDAKKVIVSRIKKGDFKVTKEDK